MHHTGVVRSLDASRLTPCHSEASSREIAAPAPRTAETLRRACLLPTGQYPQPVQRQYYVYILASRSGTLYTGITNNLERRLQEHRQGTVPGFTRRYSITRLVHYEATGSALAAITREKQIKGWRRSKKVTLVEQGNPRWLDLAAGWFD
jgi:putative endonuclease